ncbi:MAG: pentapeptide repeat-containing protein, partial [Cyanobacteria bacterium J06642_3]
LIALTYEREKIEVTKDTNLNEIYDDLLEGVYERGYEKHGYKPLEGIELGEFVGVLEEISIACWHGNGRTTTVKEIETRCNLIGLEQVLERFQSSFEQNSQVCITRLLAAFYFRESGGLRDKDKTFEFTHKSFGEYLTAKRIIEEVRDLYEELETRKQKFRKGCDEVDALVRWAELCGMSTMDEYLFEFILDEIELIYADEPELVRSWQIMLCRLIEVMLVNGMPMEKIEPRPNFLEEKRQARNSEEALLVVLNACARSTKEVSDIKWNSTKAFGAWVARLQPQRTGHATFVFQCFSWLNLENCHLVVRDLFFANLQEANLQKANFFCAHLLGANLEAANLQGSILQEANFEGANLKGANLKGANLKGAILEGADLKNTILEGKDIAEITNLSTR